MPSSTAAETGAPRTPEFGILGWTAALHPGMLHSSSLIDPHVAPSFRPTKPNVNHPTLKSNSTTRGWRTLGVLGEIKDSAHSTCSGGPPAVTPIERHQLSSVSLVMYSNVCSKSGMSSSSHTPPPMLACPAGFSVGAGQSG